MTRRRLRSTPQVNSSIMEPTNNVLVTLLQQMEENGQQDREMMLQMVQNLSSSSNLQPAGQPKNLIPARLEKLEVDTTYSKFIAWRESWNDYARIQKLGNQPSDIQRADFRCCLSEDMKVHLKCGINVSEEDGHSVDEILDRIQDYLRQKRNVALDRVAFEERKQEDGECFDNFYVAIRKLAEEGDMCDNCYDQRLVTKIMSGTNNLEVRQKLLALTPFPTLKATIELCRSMESALKDSEALNSKILVDRIKNDKTGGKNPQAEMKNCTSCGYKGHPGRACPAKGAECNSCGKKNHFAKVCKSSEASKEKYRESKKGIKTLQINGVSTQTPRITVNARSWNLRRK